MIEFNNTFEYKVIYVFSINQPTHTSLLKVGDTTLKTKTAINKLFPNSPELKRVAKERIDSYTQTAGIKYNLLYTDLAIKTYDNNGEKITKSFRDFDVRTVLYNSGYKKVPVDGTTGREWVHADLDAVIRAIDAVKVNEKFIEKSFPQDEDFTPIDFRPEQKDAIKKTVKRLKKHDKMLWNAKMRFGKTVCALQVVKEMNFARTIIITHRPVVNDGWREDFDKIFYDKKDSFIYGSKSLGISIKDLEKTCKNYVYFMSVQDLRGSSLVGGKFDKNDEVFNIDWDFVIVDEAHEGTTTELGENVATALVKANTKKLELSGTPFNIVDKFNDDELYTWDYIMEQKAKADWDNENFGDSNPYDSLPKLNIFTYNLGKLVGNGKYQEIEDKAFNFREFFRTWKGNVEQDFKPLPQNAQIGDFVNKQDVWSFLNFITKEDFESNYPYASEENRALFQHTLWMIPGVKEAKALSSLLNNHPIFGSGQFDIINVAGDGDDDEESAEALEKVKIGIANASKQGNYTITLSCGKLTTGVSIPEWTAVMMLSGSFSTSASNYLQTIFRVQTPANINGQIKTNCFVFDFAPDRTLKMVADAVNLSSKAGKTSSQDRIAMGQFLNFCPVISIDGTKMERYDENNLLQQLKRAYAEKAVKNGFDDNSIYSDVELRKLTLDDIALFDSLKGITSGKSGAKDAKSDLIINQHNLTDEQYEQLAQAQKEKRELSPDEQKIKEEIDLIKKNKQTAISILRAISIRIPLLIYGAEVEFDNDITAEQLPDLVDDNSWLEFMPSGVTKELFKDFIKYYDTDVFIAAGRKIKEIVKQADYLSPTERIQKITDLFTCFKNPDKETVLTPWRVVNMHISDTLGGYSFYDEEHKNPIDQPRFVDQGNVTKDTLTNTNAKILEINSKTGLYPLFVTYSIFRERCPNIETTSIEQQNKLWEQTVQENVFVICKTPMAKAITKRTLCGFRNHKINAHYFDNLINMLKEKPQNFIDKVLKPDYWGLKGSEKMIFDAIVGNPPYQVETAQQVSKTNGQATRTSIFQYFQIASDQITVGYTSLIYPGARWIHRSGKGMAQFGLDQINDSTLSQIDFYPDSNEVFIGNVVISDGISIVTKNKLKKESGFTYIYHKNGEITSVHLENPGEELIALNPNDTKIVNKVINFVESYSLEWIHERILPRNLFGIESNFVELNPSSVKECTESTVLKDSEIKLLANDKAGKAGRSTWFIADKTIITTGIEQITEFQVVVSSANAGGQKRDSQLEIIDNKSAFGRSRVALGTFKTQDEAQNFYNFSKTNIIKFLYLMTDEALTSLGKKVPDLGDYSSANTLLDFTGDINAQLCKLMDLKAEEVEYVKKTVESLR